MSFVFLVLDTLQLQDSMDYLNFLSYRLCIVALFCPHVTVDELYDIVNVYVPIKVASGIQEDTFGSPTTSVPSICILSYSSARVALIAASLSCLS